MVQIGRRLWLRTAKGRYKLHNSGTVVVEVAYACFKDTFRKWTLLTTVLLSKTTDVVCRRGQEISAQASRGAKPPSIVPRIDRSAKGRAVSGWSRGICQGDPSSQKEWRVRYSARD
jgi:hypothetical protein